MDVSMSVDGPANFLSGADKMAAAVDKGMSDDHPDNWIRRRYIFIH
jgi:hypothetical protein